MQIEVDGNGFSLLSGNGHKQELKARTPSPQRVRSIAISGGSVSGVSPAAVHFIALPSVRSARVKPVSNRRACHGIRTERSRD